MTGLPSTLPALVRALRPRRRLPWQEAAPVRVEARGVVLEPRRVEAFRRVCAAPAVPAVPLTFPYALVTPLHLAVVGHPGFPLAPLGLVHRSERIERLGPLAPGDVVDAAAEASGFRQTPGGVTFDLRTTLRREGRVVWTSHTTAVRRQGGGSGRPYAGDAVAVGKEEQWHVPADTGRRYGRVARNLDPIHVSALTARPFGFARAVVHGMWTAARAVAALGEPEGPAAVEVRFRSPLLLPSTVRLVSRQAEGGVAFAVWPERGERPVLEGWLG